MTFIVSNTNKRTLSSAKALQPLFYTIALVVGIAWLVAITPFGLPFIFRQMLSGLFPMSAVLLWQLWRTKKPRSRKEKVRLWKLSVVALFAVLALVSLTFRSPWVCFVQLVLFVLCAIGVFRFKVRPLFMFLCSLVATYFLLV